MSAVVVSYDQQPKREHYIPKKQTTLPFTNKRILLASACYRIDTANRHYAKITDKTQKPIELPPIGFCIKFTALKPDLLPYGVPDPLV